MRRPASRLRSSVGCVEVAARNDVSSNPMAAESGEVIDPRLEMTREMPEQVVAET